VHVPRRRQRRPGRPPPRLRIGPGEGLHRLRRRHGADHRRLRGDRGARLPVRRRGLPRCTPLRVRPRSDRPGGAPPGFRGPGDRRGRRRAERTALGARRGDLPRRCGCAGQLRVPALPTGLGPRARSDQHLHDLGPVRAGPRRDGAV
ncbi:MAG: hypothetical protein AVDCRST_MAG66-285, partial [uncultured Pseudonocardia sp.]